MQPLVDALGHARKDFLRALDKEEQAVVLMAGAGAVEAIALARAKFRQKAATVPAIPPAKGGEEKKEGEEKKDKPANDKPPEPAPPPKDKPPEPVPPPKGQLPPGLKEIPDGAGQLTEATVLAKKLSAEEVRARLACLYALESLKDEAAPAGKALVKALEDDNSYVRWGAARVLGKLPPRKDAVLELAKLLADKNGDVRITAAAALERYGPAANKAVPKLVETLKGADPETQVWSIRALVAIGPEPEEAIPGLVQALSSKEAEVRMASAEALGKFGPAAKKAEEALTRATDDEHAGVRLAASRALLDILVPAKPK
jgi:HEAT repeat protein